MCVFEGALVRVNRGQFHPGVWPRFPHIFLAQDLYIISHSV